MSNYIGNQPSAGEFKKLDSIASSFNGSLTQFDLDYSTVNQSVGDATQLIVSLNGIIQEPGIAYTLGIGGGSIVFASAPASTDTCHIVLLGGVGGTTTPTDGSVTASKLDSSLKDYLEETFTANGSQTTYTLTRAAIGSNSLLLSVDGILQPSTAYSVAGTTLTISPALPNTTNVRVVHLGVQSGVYIPAADSITSNQLATLNGNLNFDDNAKAVFGEGSDLQIYHDGGNSYVKETGTGALVLQSAGPAIVLEKSDGENMILANIDGDVKLYYNGSEKLATTSSGIDVTGTATMDGLTIGSSSISAGTGLFQQIQTAGNNMYVGVGSNNSAYVQANGEFRIATGGYQDKVTVTTSGNVGIGTSSPASDGKLTIHGTDTDSGILLSRSSGNDVAIHNIGGTLAFRTGGQSTTLGGLTDHMRLDASGNLLVGKTSANSNAVGIELHSNDIIKVTRSGGATGYFNRQTSDGNILELAKDGSTVGSIGVADGDNIYIASDDTNDVGLKFNGDGNRITPCNASGADRGSAIDLGEANSGPFKDLYLSGGIQFDARSNKLDDYEEGTWNPVLNGGAGNATMGSGTVGFYTKVGNLVHVTGTMLISGNGTNANSLTKITGLPFAINGNGGARQVGSIGAWTNCNDSEKLTLVADPSQTFIYVIKRLNNSYSHNNTFANNANLYGFSLVYQTA
jgi:hypothetical protein